MRFLPAVLVLVALALSGCSPAVTPDPSPTTASATPTATPSASAEPTAAPVTCETILTELGRQDFADGGFTEREYETRRTDLQFMIDAGGVACRWAKPSTDIIAIVGQAPFSEADWNTLRSSLEADGFTATDDRATGFLVEPPDPAGYVSGGFLWRDGQLYYVSNPSLLNSIPALQA